MRVTSRSSTYSRAVIFACVGAVCFAVLLALSPHDAAVGAALAGGVATLFGCIAITAAWRGRVAAARLDWEGGASHEVIRGHGYAYRNWFKGQAALWAGLLLLAAGALVLLWGPRLPVVLAATAFVGMATQSLRGLFARGLRPWELGLGWAELTPTGARPSASYSLAALTLEQRIASARAQDRLATVNRGSPSSRFRVMFQTVDLGRRQPPARRVDLSRRWSQAWLHELRVRPLGLALSGIHALVLAGLLWVLLDLAGVQTVQASTRLRDRQPAQVSENMSGLEEGIDDDGSPEGDPTASGEGDGLESSDTQESWQRRHPDGRRRPPEAAPGSEQENADDTEGDRGRTRQVDAGLPGLPSADGKAGEPREVRVIEGRKCKKKHAHGEDCDGATLSDDPDADASAKGNASGKATTAGSPGPGDSETRANVRGPKQKDEQERKKRSRFAGTGKGNPFGGEATDLEASRSSGSPTAPIVIDIVPDGPARRLLDRKAQAARGEVEAAPAEAFRRPGSGEAAEAENWQPLPARLAELLPQDEALAP